MRYTRPVLRVRALNKEYRCGGTAWSSVHSVLRGIDLDMYGDEVVSVVGPPGGGKSTFLLCLSGLLGPTSGLIQWALPHVPFGAGLGQTGTPGIVYVPQRVAYYGFLTVRETLDYYGTPGANPRMNCNPTLDSILEQVGLLTAAQMPVKELSAPMIRRLQIAQALMCEPKALLLDETLSITDTATLKTLREVVHNLVETGTVVIIATHDMGVARLVGTRSLFLNTQSWGTERTNLTTTISLS
jgi:ABC-type multidrug transport system ATPase subunit